MEINLDNSALIIAADWLAERDSMLSFVLKKHGYPPLWARESGFVTLVHIILEQQVSLASALATFYRLQEHLGEITLRPDVLPKGDIALYESFRTLHALDARPNHAFFEENTLHWRPWRSVGARILWHFYLCERGRQ